MKLSWAFEKRADAAISRKDLFKDLGGFYQHHRHHTFVGSALLPMENSKVVEWEKKRKHVILSIMLWARFVNDYI